MIYPLTIKKSIVVIQSGSEVTSEQRILNQINEHMKQFGMFKHVYPDNELFYYKLDPVSLFRRRDLIGNVSISISSTKQEIETVLKTNTTRILIPLILLLIGIPLIVGNPFSFSLNDRPFMWLIIAAVLILSTVQFLLRNIAIKRLSNEIKMIIQNQNK